MSTIEHLHRGAQYLSAAGSSFLEIRSDDSQASLDWNANHKRLESRSLNDDALRLAWDYPTSSLQWLKSGSTVSNFVVIGRTHAEVCEWLTTSSQESVPGRTYQKRPRYELPFNANDDHYRYVSPDADEVNAIIELMSESREVQAQFLDDAGLNTEVRVWPHHFDMGFYVEIGEGLFMGAGLAIPDSLEGDWYYYVSGWRDGNPVIASELPALITGAWHKHWNGATLKATGVIPETVLAFLQEARSVLLNS